jgi:hypothetical protein
MFLPHSQRFSFRFKKIFEPVTLSELWTLNSDLQFTYNSILIYLYANSTAQGSITK